VHGPDGAQRGLTVFLPHGLPEPLALEWILSHHERLEVVDQRFGIEVSAPHGRTQERVALHALVAVDRQVAELPLGGQGGGVPAVGGGRDGAAGEQGQRRVADLDRQASREFARTIPRSARRGLPGQPSDGPRSGPGPLAPIWPFLTI